MSFDVVGGLHLAAPMSEDTSNVVRTSALTERSRTWSRGIALFVGPAAICVLASMALLTVPAHAVANTSAGSAAVRAIGVERSTRGAVPDSVTVPVARARTALSAAVAALGDSHYHQAVLSLDTLATRIRQATRAAKDQIGKPPTDPESDDPPGPPSVLAVVRLQHTVAMTLLPQFDGMQRTGVVDALTVTLHVDLYRRDKLIDAVVAQKPGPLGDYADGMADTLPTYDAEIQALTDALATFTLTDVSRTALEDSKQLVLTTQAKMNAAFGGGE